MTLHPSEILSPADIGPAEGRGLPSQNPHRVRFLPVGTSRSHAGFTTFIEHFPVHPRRATPLSRAFQVTSKVVLQRPPRKADFNFLHVASVHGSQGPDGGSSLVSIKAIDRAAASVGVKGGLDIAIPRPGVIAKDIMPSVPAPTSYCSIRPSFRHSEMGGLMDLCPNTDGGSADSGRVKTVGYGPFPRNKFDRTHTSLVVILGYGRIEEQEEH